MYTTFNYEDLRECARMNGCPLEDWNYISGGYWFSVKFDEESMEFDYIKIGSLLDDLQRAGFTIASHNSYLDSDGENAYMFHEVEIIR